MLSNIPTLFRVCQPQSQAFLLSLMGGLQNASSGASEADLPRLYRQLAWIAHYTRFGM